MRTDLNFSDVYRPPKVESLSVTEQQDFASCRRYWLWANYGLADGKGYFVSKAPQPNFWVGNLVHSGLEGYFKANESLNTALAFYDNYYNVLKKEIQQEFSYIWDQMQMELINLYQLGREMIINYDKFHQSGQSIIYGQVEHVEHKIHLPILDPNTRMPTGRTLVGKLDLTLRDDSGVTIVDHKTAGSAPNFGGVDIDDQLTAYCYMYWREFGEIPNRVVYDVLLKSLPEPPALLKAGGFSKAKNQTTVYEVYRETLERAGEDLKQYSAILDYFRLRGWSSFFIQVEATRNEAELLAYERRVFYRSQDMAFVLDHPDTYAYPTPSARGCGWCPFLSPCKAMDDGGDYMTLLETMFTRKEWNSATDPDPEPTSSNLEA